MRSYKNLIDDMKKYVNIYYDRRKSDRKLRRYHLNLVNSETGIEYKTIIVEVLEKNYKLITGNLIRKSISKWFIVMITQVVGSPYNHSREPELKLSIEEICKLLSKDSIPIPIKKLASHLIDYIKNEEKKDYTINEEYLY